MFFYQKEFNFNLEDLMKKTSKSTVFKVFDIAESKTVATENGLMPVEEFAEKEGFQWTESPVSQFPVKEFFAKNRKKIEEQQMKSLLKESLIETDIKVEKNTSLNDMLNMFGLTKEGFKKVQNENAEMISSFLKKNNLNAKLVVCFINDLVGKGVFLAKKSQPISANEIVSLYTGVYEGRSDEKSSLVYGLDLPEHPVFSDALNLLPIKGVINAEKFGNISRYFNDMPTQEELTEWYNVRPEVIKEIATANLQLLTTYYNYCPVAYFSATDNITEGQLGFSFGPTYWAKAEYLLNIKRCLFYKNGKLVEEENYQSKFLNLEISLENSNNNSNRALYYPFKIKDLKSSLIEGIKIPITDYLIEKWYELTSTEFLPALVKKLSGIDADPKDFYKARFSVSIKLILMDFLCENAYPDSELSKQKVSYVKKLYNAIAGLKDNDADNIYKTVTDMMLYNIDYKKFYMENLTELRNEIIKAMVKYNFDLKEQKNSVQQETPNVQERAKVTATIS